jgi:hypothetical protein
MRHPHFRSARRRRLRPLAAGLGLAAAAATTGVAWAQPAHAADWNGRLFTIDGTLELHDMNDDLTCTRHITRNAVLRDDEYVKDKEKSFTFRRTCGDITAEVYVVAKLEADNDINTSGWVRVLDGKDELAWRAHAAEFEPEWQQEAGPIWLGDPTRGLVYFHWVMRNEDGWT